MKEWIMIIFLVAIAATAIWFGPDGFFGRWCSAYPEFCEPLEVKNEENL